MAFFLYFLGGLLFVILVLLASVQPSRSSVSRFELHRRQKLRDKKAEEALAREEILDVLCMLKAPITATLLILLTAICIVQLGLVGGLVAALIVGLAYSRLARLSFIRQVVSKVYRRYEDKLLLLAATHENKLRLFAGKPLSKPKFSSIGSKEELTHLLEVSPIISADDKNLLKHTLRFRDQKVSDVMISRNKMHTIGDAELLGPLVLDDLHKTGHTIFPVTKGKDIVGLLDIRDHAELHTKESVHIRSVMRSDIEWIDHNDGLETALRKFISSKQPLLLVRDEDQAVVGMVTMGDIIQVLTGWNHG